MELTKTNRSAEDMKYVLEFLEINPGKNPKRFDQCIETMATYDTPWWRELSGNAVALANCQIDQPVLLIPWSLFKTGVEKVLGRHITDKELTSSNTKLIEEFHVKYKELYEG